jgi:hypothetical protein
VNEVLTLAWAALTWKQRTPFVVKNVPTLVSLFGPVSADFWGDTGLSDLGKLVFPVHSDGFADRYD